ncbi:TPA: hypothetical protein DCX15_00715 [bacterium]|nr:hypothetical protein [bacterium]
MIKVADEVKQEVIERVYHAGQEDVFRFWNELSQEARERLLDQLASIDFEVLNRLIDKYVLHSEKSEMDLQGIEPAPFIRTPETPGEVERQNQAKAVGEKALREGRVACFLVAGGEGTRLGYDGPKGVFPIGPISKKSLFQLHAEKILAIRKRYGRKLPWYVMTSPPTDRVIRDFFKSHNFFGLPQDEIRFLTQGVFPAVNFEGRLLMAAKDQIVMSPNGHGGSLKVLKESGALDQMEKEGIDIVFYFQVDNPLLKIADPIFIGYHLEEKADMSCKIVKKRDPLEKVGVVCRINGHLQVIEYSELPIQLVEEKDLNGVPRFRAGSIAIHILRVDFIKRKKLNLPCHPARKKIPFIDARGQPWIPDEPNGIKFETFIFDALPSADKWVLMEVVRKEEFSPLKEKEGPSSPDLVQQNMTELYASWLQEAGVEIPKDRAGKTMGLIEISPLYALDKEELLEKIDKNLVFDGKLYLDG